MPAEYLACVRSLISEGKSEKDAQRICAISYYKKHGKTPQEDEGKSSMNTVNQSALYASLRREFGPGKIVKAEKPITLTAKFQLAQPPLTNNKTFNRPVQQARASSSPSSDLPFTFVLTTSGANENLQVFLEEDLMRPEVFNSILGEAIDWDHDQSFMAVCGEVVNSQYFPPSGDKKSGIRCDGIIFSDLYPEIAKKICRGAGRWAAVSMEALPNPLEEIGPYLVIHNPRFMGVGIVRLPGCLDAIIEEVDEFMSHKPEDLVVSDKILQSSLEYFFEQM